MADHITGSQLDWLLSVLCEARKWTQVIRFFVNIKTGSKRIEILEH